jgi:hypothetical protein
VSNASFYGSDDLAAKFFRLKTDIEYSIPSKDKLDMVDASLKNGIRPFRFALVENPCRPLLRTTLPIRSSRMYNKASKANNLLYTRKTIAQPVASKTKEDMRKEEGDETL